MTECIKTMGGFVRADAIVAIEADRKDENYCDITVSGATWGDVSDGGAISSDLRVPCKADDLRRALGWEVLTVGC